MRSGFSRRKRAGKYGYIHGWSQGLRYGLRYRLWTRPLNLVVVAAIKAGMSASKSVLICLAALFALLKTTAAQVVAQQLLPQSKALLAPWKADETVLYSGATVHTVSGETLLRYDLGNGGLEQREHCGKAD